MGLEHFTKLYLENDWSKGFYLYMMGICYLNMGQHDKALDVCVRKGRERKER